METVMSSLQPGQTCEIADAYVGMIDKVQARGIVHRLTKQQQQKRLHGLSLIAMWRYPIEKKKDTMSEKKKQKPL
ncbi:hypothetical protein [Bacillus proteolyticus]|uniref:hypothetical protein n=1 Tax=Bacillus proteolyticus TaxID=2026192 RepID=UPI003D9C6D80